MTYLSESSSLLGHTTAAGCLTGQVINHISDCITCITDDIACIIEYSICSVCAACCLLYTSDAADD